MAGDREAAPESRGTVAEHAATPSSAGGGSAIAAAAHAVCSGPAQVANVLRQFPAQRDAIIGWLHATCGNAYVQAVLTHRAPEEGPAWDVFATPQIVQFPETEVGAVSPPRTFVLANRGHVPIDIESLELVRHGGTGASAYPGEFELIQGQAGQLRPLETMAVQIVPRPTRVVPYIGARLRAKGHGAHDHGPAQNEDWLSPLESDDPGGDQVTMSVGSRRSDSPNRNAERDKRCEVPIRDFAAYYLSQIADKPLALKEEPPMSADYAMRDAAIAKLVVDLPGD